MKLFAFFIAYFCVTVSIGQSHDSITLQVPVSIDLTISTDSDTLVMGKKMFLHAIIKNNSDTLIVIPKHYNVVSNLFPHEYSDNHFYGGLFKLTIDTLSDLNGFWSDEEISITRETVYIDIYPSKSLTYEIDIGNQINAYNKIMTGDNSKLARKQFHTLQMIYVSRDGNTENNFIGRIESNKLRIFFK